MLLILLKFHYKYIHCFFYFPLFSPMTHTHTPFKICFISILTKFIEMIQSKPKVKLIEYKVAEFFPKSTIKNLLHFYNANIPS